jgi:hypothetical protein
MRTPRPWSAEATERGAASSEKGSDKISKCELVSVPPARPCITTRFGHSDRSPLEVTEGSQQYGKNFLLRAHRHGRVQCREQHGCSLGSSQRDSVRADLRLNSGDGVFKIVGEMLCTSNGS